MLLAAWMPGRAAAAEDELRFEGDRIVAIDFEPVEQPYSRAVLDKLLSIRVGEPLALPAVRATIQNLYSTGRFSGIEIGGTMEGDGVRLRITTELNYFVSQVTVTGAKDPPNEGQLAGAAKLGLGTEFVDNDAVTAVEYLSDRLRANGLYQARVKYTVERVPATQEARIQFQVDPGARARFAGVEISGTPQRSLESIIRTTRWKLPLFQAKWRTVTEARVRSGVENVRRSYQNANHLLASISLQQLQYKEGANQLIPLLHIEPGPRVGLTSAGAKIPKGLLKNLVPVFQERTVDKDLLVEGRRNLIDYYQAKGYFDATVNFNFQAEKQGEQSIAYTLERGVRHRVHSVKIDGNRYFNDRTVRERLAVTPASWPRYPRGRYSPKLLERDVESILALYRSNGFRDVKVDTEVDDKALAASDELIVLIHITEGPQWFVRKLVIEGASNEERQYFDSVLSSIEGQPFSQSNLAADRDNVLTYYFNRGYPDAAFEWAESDTEAPSHVDLLFRVKPGRRQYVRDILINGLHATKPKLVQDRIRFSPGEPLAESSLSETQRRLYELGIFAKVQVATQNPGGEEDSRYVLYQLDEASRYSMTFGFGAEFGRIGGGTSLDAPAGKSGFSPRVSFGVSRLNVLGLGHTLSLQTRVSNIQDRVLLTYFAPHFLEFEHLSLTVSGLFDNSSDIRTFSALRGEGSIQLAQRLSRSDSLQYRYSFRRVTVSSLLINPQLVPLFSQPTRTGILSATYIHDRRDDPIDAKRGMYNTVDFGVSASQFGSKTPFVRMLERNSTYHRINPSLVFARSTNIGLIQGFAEGADIPLPERFFSGGSFSHRGFPNNQAGPRDTFTGFPVGGSALFLNSLELRFPLLGDTLGGVVFHDAGNVYSDIDKVTLRSRQKNYQDFDYMVHAMGVGFRYRTPVGPLRIDLSYSPNAPRFVGFQGTRDQLLFCAGPGSQGILCPSVPQGISRFQFHFSLGQSF
jgi:outer membrane protein insertion porin family